MGDSEDLVGDHDDQVVQFSMMGIKLKRRLIHLIHLMDFFP